MNVLPFLLLTVGLVAILFATWGVLSALRSGRNQEQRDTDTVSTTRTSATSPLVPPSDTHDSDSLYKRANWGTKQQGLPTPRAPSARQSRFATPGTSTPPQAPTDQADSTSHPPKQQPTVPNDTRARPDTPEQDISHAPPASGLSADSIGASPTDGTSSVDGAPRSPLKSDATTSGPNKSSEEVEPTPKPDLDGSSSTKRGNRRMSQYRDQRGKKRRPPLKTVRSPNQNIRSARADIRISLRNAEQRVKLTLMLRRPTDFPDTVRVALNGDEIEVSEYDSDRYDDIDFPHAGDMLGGEIRIRSSTGHQWSRAPRSLHLFSPHPDESGCISCGAARAGESHVIVCKHEDESAVRDIAASVGSPPLVSHLGWTGIPEGWRVFSNYFPRHPATISLPTEFSPLNIDSPTVISLEGGMRIRGNQYADIEPPEIRISELAPKAEVTIDGKPAVLCTGRGWQAEDWDTPGAHRVDIVPGPSRTYNIVADPAAVNGWKFCNSHPDRFGENSCPPWAQAEICGAALKGPLDQTLIAVAGHPCTLTLGTHRGVTYLQPRENFPVSVALVPEPPAYLVSTLGQKRIHGSIEWLGSWNLEEEPVSPDLPWAHVVCLIAARQLSLVGAGSLGKLSWEGSKERARAIRRSHR